MRALSAALLAHDSVRSLALLLTSAFASTAHGRATRLVS
jgi:hypothetical protein